MTPAPWLVAHLDVIAPDGRVLDVASGRGRNALFVAASGRRVHAVDRDAGALAALTRQAASAGLDISTEVLDLETGDPVLGHGIYAGIIVFNYLHRALFPKIIAALSPGGVLIYETFTVGQALRGRPRNPAYLLQPGELRALAAPLQVVSWREGEFDDKLVASIVARK